MGTAEHAKVVERWFGDLFTRGDLSAVDDLVAPDFVSYDPSGRRARDLASWKAWLRWYLAAFTDTQWTVHEIVSDGEKAAVRYSGETTYRGGWLGIPSTNQRVTEMGVLIFTIRGGKVRTLHAALSDLELATELGAVLVPGGRTQQRDQP